MAKETAPLEQEIFNSAAMKLGECKKYSVDYDKYPELCHTN